jgi:diguanylate cyclase (GGDEF)-like protein/PAS domain S-box-containing protein
MHMNHLRHNGFRPQATRSGRRARALHAHRAMRDSKRPAKDRTGEPRALLIDDDEKNIGRLRQMLGSRFPLETVGNLAAVLQRVGDRPCDVFLLNLAGPEPGGLPAVTLLRASFPDIPVIALAPSGLELLALKAVHEGAADYLITDDLYETIVVRTFRHVLERHRSELRQRRAEEELRASEQRYRALFEQSHDGIFVLDRAGRINEVNRAAAELLQTTAEELSGQPLHSFYDDEADRTRAATDFAAEVTGREREVRIRRPDGERLWCLLSVAPRITDAGEMRGFQAVVHDITGRRRAEEELLRSAFRDGLTGLANRALFLDRLSRVLAARRRVPSHRCAVLFIDLDRFKIVNDSLGHATGDALLRRVANRLAGCIRRSDTVARIGGDEFAVLLDGMEADEDAFVAARRIHTALEKPLRLSGHGMIMSASIGIALPEREEDTAEDLLRNADIAMYLAKRRGPARYEVFSDSMRVSRADTLSLEADLRGALSRSEFVLHYQPIYQQHERRIIGMEALIRWQHPKRGLLLPGEFLPLAEEIGLMLPMGWWALRETCAEGRRLMELCAPGKQPMMAMNLTATHISRDDLVETVAAILEETGFPPTLLSLEVTETSLVGNPAAVAVNLARLRELGIRISIDDFGTGYSSLSYLQDLPVDTLKIDRSFISRLGTGDDPLELVRTLVGLAERLGMSTVAEGVETAEQLRQLEMLGPMHLQGFLFSRPVEAVAARELLAGYAN